MGMYGPVAVTLDFLWANYRGEVGADNGVRWQLMTRSSPSPKTHLPPPATLVPPERLAKTNPLRYIATRQVTNVSVTLGLASWIPQRLAIVWERGVVLRYFLVHDPSP